MRCFIKQGAKTAGLHDHMWWLRVEGTFTALMIGRYLNDGKGLPPPSAESVVRGLRIFSLSRRVGHLEDIYALVESIDRASRRNREESGGGSEVEAG
jgi:hypothetical protein